MVYRVTADDVAPVLDVIIWMTLVISILTVIARLLTKGWLQRKLSWDDAVIVAAIAFSVTQSVLLSRSVAYGLGTRGDGEPDNYDVMAILRTYYGSNILYILSVSAAKASVLMFIVRLTAQKRWTWGSLGLLIALGVWTFAAVFAIAFQCSVPYPWIFVNVDGIAPHCIDRDALWTAIEIINLLFDISIITLPTIILSGVQTTMSKKITAISMFACRIIVVALIPAKIVYMRREIESQDPLFDLWPTVIFTQFIVCASIVCSSMHYLKPFLDSIESGLLGAPERRQDGSSRLGYGSRKSPMYGSELSNGGHTPQQHHGRRHRGSVPMNRISVARQTSHAHRSRRSSDVESEASESKILQTRTFTVTSEPKEPHSHEAPSLTLPQPTQPHAM